MSSRLAPPRVPSGNVAVQAPPEIEAADGGSSMLTSMLPMLGSVGAIIMVSVSNAGPTGWLTGGMFLVSALGFVFVNGWRQRAQRQATILGNRREYLAYLTELRQTVRTAAKAQRRERNWRYPAPETLSYLVEDGTRVWERDVSDDDHLTVRVGTSEQPLCLRLEAPELPPIAQLDPVATTAAHRFIATHENQPELPTFLRLSSHTSVQIVGDDLEHIRGLARSLVTHLATMQSPEELLIVVAASPDSLPHWEWAKWLPHAQSPRLRDSLGPARMIGSDTATLLGMLPASLRERPRFVLDAPVTTPHVLVIVDGAKVSPTDPVFAGGLQGVTVLDLPSSWDDNDDPSVVRISLGAGTAEVAEGSRHQQTITPDHMTVVEAEAVARRLAPLHREVGGNGPVSRASNKQMELTELLGLPDVRDLDFTQQWRYLPERDRLRVPIGQDTNGAPLILDLKESASQGMGPHGLIIGATGSGKSEVLRTLVLSLALTHSPEQLNFVLVDFKGGATFAGMADMPHVSAIITNLGDEISLVDRMQDALQGEMVRRQELLRSAGNFVNVGEYEKARRGGRTDLAPLPALLIVADEFSELLSAKPEFVESFVAIGRLGRSLHVHLLLASQRLEESRLKGLDTHLSYRIGLRTFSAAESRTVIGVPDAYHLPQEPGGGLLKVGSDENLTQFRAAYVSGPPPARRAVTAGSGASGALAATRITQFTAAPQGLTDPEEEGAAASAAAERAAAEAAAQQPEEKRSVFELAVSSMAGLGPAAHQVWLPPLETPATLDQLLGELSVSYDLGLHAPRWRAHRRLTVPIGMVDVPAQQRRDLLTLDLSGAAGHVAIVGAPLAGKSTAARTLVAALALTHTPHEVQVFAIDFGGSFAGLRNLPHLAGLATRGEPEVIRRTVAEITSLLNAREAYFREQGIDSIDTYRTRRAQGVVDDGYGDIFLVVDGWATMRADYESLEVAVQEIAARGLSFGIHVIITANRWLEIRPAMKDLMGGKIELRLGDAGDSEIGRKAAGNVSALPGRGLDPSGLQMLTALPRIDGETTPETLVDGVDDLVEKVISAWQREPGPKLRLLPQVLPLAELQAHPAANPNQLLLGLDEAELAPVGIDPTLEQHLFLYGDSGSGKSSMLRGLVHEITRRYEPGQARIFMIDYRRAHLGEIPEDYLGAYVTSAEQASGAIAQLVEFFRGRLPGPNVTAAELRNRSWWTGAEGFVLIDDYDLVANQQGNPAAPLAQLLAQASDVGLHVIVTRRTGGASRAAYDPILQGMTDLGVTGILLSGSPEEGQLIAKVKAMPSAPGRAQVVSRARGHQIAQLAYVPTAHESGL
ncbi:MULTISPECIES: type VII secretion protein EccCa [unclassified Leucobacter]|uniref:type VII secretion protein EccCa n=1 Tax=unclassified Leucobacter TaxID=2621730 RepID=UPI00165E8201|nr:MULTISPECIES: type VII secretion protein EccCa [unclassified Leucobacter]MBC9936573.1 type VII secretion protein EccCa [Leucobacter sp. cx-87]